MNLINSVVIYSRKGCSRCDAAEQLIESTDINYCVRSIDLHKQRLLKQNPELKKLPVIEINNKIIGSLEELQTFIEKLRK